MSDNGPETDSADPSEDPSAESDGALNDVRKTARSQYVPEGVTFLREIATSVIYVSLIGLLLFGVSGVWPPMVAVESGSMQPHMSKGDLVVVSEPGRYAPEGAYGETGVLPYTHARQTKYTKFGSSGSVVVYSPPDEAGPPIIHRARFRVEEGENWYDRADSEYINADNCRELLHCPAPHSGFITKGDNNAGYDQSLGLSPPVKPAWIVGIAHVRVPYLGCVRLELSGSGCLRGVPGTIVPVESQNGYHTQNSDGRSLNTVRRTQTYDATSPSSTKPVS